MGDSSDDDVPLGARHKVQGVVLDLDSDSDKGSPVPDWISQHTSPLKTQQRESTADSNADNEVLDLVSQQPESQATQQEADTRQAGEAGPNGASKSLAGAGKKTPKSGKKGTAASRAQAAASVLPTAGASQPFPVAAIPEAAAAGEVPILITEKMAKGRWLVELDPSDTGATDLTGDAGAVGRFSVIGSGAGQELLLDLKGVIYSASLNRAATTLCVVSLVNPSEARVEALMDSYISLREETAAGGGGANPGPANDNDFFIFDDDDLYQADQFREEGAGMATGKRKAKAEAEDAPKPKKKAGGSAGGGKGTTAKRKAPAKKSAKGGGTKGGKKK